GPEVQSGTEAGFDILFRHALSLQVTHFDQRASGLVQQVAIAADSGYQSRHVTYALEDVGEISNRGWEIAAAESVSRLSVTGALSADNLLNYQRGEPDNITVVPGRTILSGVRVKF